MLLLVTMHHSMPNYANAFIAGKYVLCCRWNFTKLTECPTALIDGAKAPCKRSDWKLVDTRSDNQSFIMDEESWQHCKRKKVLEACISACIRGSGQACWLLPCHKRLSARIQTRKSIDAHI